MNLGLVVSFVSSNGFGVLDMLTGGSSVLLLLAAAAIVYRTYRERHLAVWIGGWLFYLIYTVCQAARELGSISQGLDALSQAAFIIALAFFVSAVLIYTGARKLLLPVSILALVAVDCAVIRAFWFANSPAFAIAIHVMYRIMTATAVVSLILFSRGRRELGSWLLTVTLLFLHLDENRGVAHTFAGSDIIIEVLFGLSMVVLVLDDSRARTRRLGVVNSITMAIAEAHDHSTMISTAIRELKLLMSAKAVWFRLVQSDRLVMVQQLGLPPELSHSQGAFELDESAIAELLSGKAGRQLRTSKREMLKRYGMEHIILVPVSGKKSIIGVLALGMPRHRSHSADEMSFLQTTANQIGIAVENLQLFEQVLRSQQQWVSTVDSMEDSMLVHDPEGRIMRVNRAFLQRLGNPHQSAVVQKLCSQVLPHAAKGCPYCSRSHATVESPDPCFGGYSLVSTSSYSEEHGAGIGTIHIIKDTTERRLAEERYHLMFEEVQEGVFISTPEGRLIECNDAFVRMLGYSNSSEVLALDIAHCLYDSPKNRELFLQAIAKNGFVRNLEVRLRRNDGSIITVLENSFASRDASGKVMRFQGFLVDITEKKRTEDEIRRRNRELNALNSIAVIATRSFDLDEILNVTLRQVTELLSAQTGSILLFDADRKLLTRKAVHGMQQSSQRVTMHIELPVDFIKRLIDGRVELITTDDLTLLPEDIRRMISPQDLPSWVWVNMWSQNEPIGTIGVSSSASDAFSALDKDLLVAIARQLATTVEKVRLYEETSRAYEYLRRTQEQLLQSEKMSAVGQLIAGVAHELNNPLTAILGYAQLLEGEPIDERSRDFVQKLYKQAQRTHRLVQNLLSFARQRKPIKQHCDLRKVMEDTLALRDYDLKLNNIVVTRELPPELPQVVADSYQLEQVFLNIVNNAADAVLERARGGTLDVRIFRDSNQVVVEFHDSGPGIKNPQRIFDPFYTTKKVGKGTGLGLSICYGILKEHGGDISAFNHAEGGAVFQVRLPVAELHHAATPAPNTDAKDHFVGARILLVDDEEPILEFESEVLTGAGAKVVALTGGEEAIALLQSEDFDAIIIDGRMPGGWSGQEIYRWLRDNRSGLEKRIILSMSHESDPDLRNFLEQNNVPCLMKPFEVTDLLSVVRRVVCRPQAAGA